jgi:hypothetical protein
MVSLRSRAREISATFSSPPLVRACLPGQGTASCFSFGSAGELPPPLRDRRALKSVGTHRPTPLLRLTLILQTPRSMKSLTSIRFSSFRRLLSASAESRQLHGTCYVLHLHAATSSPCRSLSTFLSLYLSGAGSLRFSLSCIHTAPHSSHTALTRLRLPPFLHSSTII